ncbi:uncharacterized protein LOC116848246 isoform X2 [Odontomachus brunneus]|nr:uncharacterized protein LOC116848246 isoform X2 [Odontomachus brunneus]
MPNLIRKSELEPQNLCYETPSVSETKFQNLKDSKFKVEDFRKRKQVKRSYVNCNKQSQIPAININTLDEEVEDANLLPSKRGNKMSEITLIPIGAKVCGCSGPCEIIICEVIVQQYVDQDEVSLMLAMNIEEEEIDAHVMKHCDDKYCDALNIDHDRCRRGLIELYRCDQSDVCDVCQETMKDWKSRLYHEGCEKKNEYRHNNVRPEHLLKDRFRLRELQILEDSSVRRRNNYLDPVTGPALALETIRNNKELIITPWTRPNLEPAVTTTTVSSNALASVSQAVAVNSQASKPKNIVDNTIMTSVRSNATLSSSGTSLYPKQNVAQQAGPALFSNAQRNMYIVTSSNTTPISAVPLPQNRHNCRPNSISSITQPATVKPITVRPATVRPATVQLATVKSTTVQPATVQPAIVRPATMQPAIVRPATVQPAIVRPATVQPATVRPATVQLATVKSTIVQPATVRPATVQLATVQSTTVKPTTVQSATVQSAIVQPTTMSNLIVSQPHVATNTSDQPKPLLAPIRVIPITNLKSAPSLLHRQQGIPKFCVITGNVITTLTVPNTQAIQSIIAANIVAQQENAPKIPEKAKPPASTHPSTQKRRIFPQKRILSNKPNKPNKQFFCVYCCKYFSTVWYFKKHVARHEREKHTPRVSITSLYDKHGRKTHVSEKQDVREVLDYDYDCDSPSSIKSSTDRINDELEPQVQVEYDTEYCDGDLVNETNCTTIGDTNQVEKKKIKCEKTFDIWNGNIEIFRNGIKIEAQDDVNFEDSFFTEHHDIEESSFNENYNTEENNFTIVSVGNIDRNEHFDKL